MIERRAHPRRHGRRLARDLAGALWRSLDFEVIGTVPPAFAHPRHGDVGLHIRHRSV
ncbi:MAG TPA: hypothetical protein VKV21_17810 [Solirubrobacteraceae bacterium]|nr:hypothetical protein [Solirubrobacteraceae bacterium]